MLINIKDEYTINIGVRFSIITQRGYNKNEVLLRCIDAVKNHFDIDKWSISQPIILSDILCDIISRWCESVVPPEDDNPQKQMVVIENKYKVSDGYSGHVYDLQSTLKMV